MNKGANIRLVRLFLLVAVGFFLAVAPARAEDTAGVYKSKCVACHDADGKGNTPIAKNLGVHDFASHEETNDEFFTITQKGRNKMPVMETARRMSRSKTWSPASIS